jgi:hypothetical protein
MLNCMHADKAKGYCYFSQVQGKYNSNLAHQEKLAHGLQIHQVSNSALGQSTYQYQRLHSQFSFSLQPSNLIQRHRLRLHVAAGSLQPPGIQKLSTEKIESKSIGLYFVLHRHSIARAAACCWALPTTDQKRNSDVQLRARDTH